MKFTCEKSSLYAAILTAARAVPSKSPLPLLEGLLLEAYDGIVRVVGYDLKTGILTEIQADVEENGAIVLNARLFGEIIRKMPGSEITFANRTGEVATISSEMSEFEIIGFAPSDYPDLPDVQEESSFDVAEGTLRKMISQTIFAVSDNETRPIHTGALFETSGDTLTIVAVDGFRLALRREKVKTGMPVSFVVPGAALTEVERILSDDSEKMMTIKLGDKHIVFVIGDSMVITRRLEGEFLNYKQAIPQKGEYSIVADKNELVSAVERVALIISDKIRTPIRCKFGDNEIALSSFSALGKAQDVCYADGSGGGLEIGFNNKYLTEALKAAPSEAVELCLSNNMSPCIITPYEAEDNYLYMILPVRLKASEN